MKTSRTSLLIGLSLLLTSSIAFSGPQVSEEVAQNAPPVHQFVAGAPVAFLTSRGFAVGQYVESQGEKGQLIVNEFNGELMAEPLSVQVPQRAIMPTFECYEGICAGDSVAIIKDQLFNQTQDLVGTVKRFIPADTGFVELVPTLVDGRPSQTKKSIFLPVRLMQSLSPSI